MTTETLASTIVGHLVGDYLLQNDWMALNKRKSSFPCAVHCVLWSMSVCLFAGWGGFVIPVVLFVTHFIQDRTNIIQWWMGVNNQKQFASGPCSPWSIIVVDNVWHIVVIYFVNIYSKLQC